MRASPPSKCGICNDGRSVAAFLVSMYVTVVVVVMGGRVGMAGMAVVCMEALECEPDELRFSLEPERGVDDGLPDIVNTPIHPQYAARVWVLWDSSGEDNNCEFGREVREGRHGEIRVPPPGDSISLSLAKSRR